MSHIKEANTDPDHKIRVWHSGNHVMMAYRILKNFTNLDKKYLSFGHHGNTVYSEVDLDVFAKVLDVFENPRAIVDIKDLQKLGIASTSIESPEVFLNYSLLQQKIDEDMFVHVTCDTHRGTHRFKFHPDYCSFHKEGDITYQTLTIEDYSVEKPLTHIKDGTDTWHMVFNHDESMEFLSKIPRMEIEPELSKLQPSSYQHYLLLLNKHNKMFVSQFCRQMACK